ncbi:hypothetical protein GQ55_9G584000 [Panicum hallii var. hallii]|uniref:Uncharacterized protein n=1 Tax=Panicum hallii var. hallii TaxID=1504633 RepID=A0A2T7CGH7_9POAL|nr:hypothetical protein GQ55_9G584000 [Panicum hallii var. hallii]
MWCSRSQWHRPRAGPARAVAGQLSTPSDGIPCQVPSPRAVHRRRPAPASGVQLPQPTVSPAQELSNSPLLAAFVAVAGSLHFQLQSYFQFPTSSGWYDRAGRDGC